MNYKKIFQSYDFINNSIINARLGTDPVDDNHLVHKKYVDDSFVYSTDLSKRYANSTTIERMKNNDGKTYAQLFDQLLYGVINPKYYEPETFIFDVTCHNSIPESHNKFYNGLNNYLFIYVETVYNDRTYYEDPTLTIAGVQCELIEKTDNKRFCFKSNVVTTITNVLFTQKFGAYVDVPKQDNYGNDYIDPEFQIVKITTTNFTSEVNRRLTVCNPVLVSQRRGTEGSPDYSDVESFNVFSFEFTDIDQEEVRDILIPEKDFDRLKYVYLTSDGHPCETEYCQYNLLAQYTNMEPVVINDIKYLKGQYNFGYCFPNAEGINGIGLYV